ncbi:MAG: phosphotransferase [Burkholderiaceae bacterium]
MSATNPASGSETEKFSGTMPVAERQRFDENALTAYLSEHVDGFKGPLTVRQFRGGQSNPTFRLETPGRHYVMRSKPGPVAKLLPSAHAIEREYRLLSALADTDVPTAKVYALCEDESVIGRAFYIMECVDGRILWDQHLPDMTPAQRADIYDEMNRVIATLHQVDVEAVGLGDFGRPGNYFARQIGRWSKQYLASETEPIDAMHQLIAWLPEHIPDSEGSSIVHGDYRLDNMVFHPTEPRVLAVLDWELATIGHPLADFSYNCMSWHIAPGKFRGIAGLDHASLGIPSEQDYIAAYCRRTGREGIEHWDFYIAYNMFRLAAILQGIAKRVLDGTAASDRGAEAGERARPLAEQAWQIVQRIA